MRLLAPSLFAAFSFFACVTPAPEPATPTQAPQEEPAATQPAATVPDQPPVAAPQPAPKAQSCGGIAGGVCPKGTLCTDDPGDSCDPKNGGRDCMGLCLAPKSQAEGQECKPVLCRMYCKNGWQVGPDGCEICACAP